MKLCSTQSAEKQKKKHCLIILITMLSLFWFGTSTAEQFPKMDCVITPSEVVDISSEVPGVLKVVSVERSELVMEGQVVAQLEDGVEQATLALANARVTMDNEIQIGKVNVQYDQHRQERFQHLQQSKLVSFQDADDVQRQAELSQLKLKQAEDLQYLRELELNKAAELLKQKTIFSPITGVVSKRYKSTGEFVKEQPILRVAKLDPLHVEAIVPMSYFGQIKVGMAAKVLPENSTEESKDAIVSLVDRMGDAASGTFGVRLKLSNPNYRIPAGLKCSMQLITREKSSKTARDGIARNNHR